MREKNRGLKHATFRLASSSLEHKIYRNVVLVDFRAQGSSICPWHPSKIELNLPRLRTSCSNNGSLDAWQPKLNNLCSTKLYLFEQGVNQAIHFSPYKNQMMSWDLHRTKLGGLWWWQSGDHGHLFIQRSEFECLGPDPIKNRLRITVDLSTLKNSVGKF